jgi:hypothetical protein
MNSLGISWKVYAQSYAAAGGTVTTPDNAQGTSYYRRHNGATWYAEVLNNVNNSQANIVDFSQFATDLASDALPRFTIIVPDGAHDAHDCPSGEAACLQAADDFLNTNLSPMLSKPYFQSGGDGLLIVTFDECGSGNNTDNNCAAQVYTAVIGPKVISGTISSKSYKHENTLGTVLSALGITATLGAASASIAMTDFFQPSGNDLSDVTWSCVGNCGPSTVGTLNQLDGASAKMQYTGGAGFTDAIWSNPLSSDYSGKSTFTYDLSAMIAKPNVAQAFEFHMIQIVGGQEYPFQVQCSIMNTHTWRVWQSSPETWIDTGVACTAPPANVWIHYTFHFDRVGNQLHYQDMTINGITYTFNKTATSVTNSNPASLTLRVRLVGDSVGDPYAIWIDEVTLQ